MADKPEGTESVQDQNQNQEGNPAAAHGSPQPQIDVESMRQAMREEIQQAISTIDKDQSLPGYSPQRDQDLNHQTAQPQATENPLKAVLDPYLQPQLKALGLLAQGAQDAAIFYGTHQDALEFKEDIEKAFNALINQGTPFAREAVWEWYRGKNFDKFYQKKKESEDNKLAQAGDAMIVGSGARPNVQTKEAFVATDDELEKGLKDVAF